MMQYVTVDLRMGRYAGGPSITIEAPVKADSFLQLAADEGQRDWGNEGLG